MVQYKNRLAKQAWNLPEYTTGKVSQTNLALVKLYDLAAKAENILDLGCADGKILGQIYRKDAKFVGVDIARRSIEKAKKAFKGKRNVRFVVGDIEKLDLGEEKFDLVYSTYVLEHVDKPEVVLEKMIKLLMPQGILVVICPNYGSPVEYSPGSPKLGETLGTRAIKLFVESWLKRPGLAWREVVPPILTSHKYVSDADVTHEPYLGTLVKFFENRGIETVEAESGIEKIAWGKNYLGLIKFVCLSLGKIGIAPFKYYGPRIFYFGVKTKTGD